MRRCSRCTHPVYLTDRYCLNCGQPLHRTKGAAPWLMAGLFLLLCAVGAKAGGLVIPSGTAQSAPTSAGSAATPAPLVAATGSVPSPCHFVLGFKTLHDLMPARIGACLDNERYDPVSGDAVQHTSGGLLVWRKSDNAAAFTDGSATWVLGPLGMQQRPNDRRFRWETNPSHLPVITLTIA